MHDGFHMPTNACSNQTTSYSLVLKIKLGECQAIKIDYVGLVQKSGC